MSPSGSGCKHCAAWMNLEMGISLQLAWEYLRVARKLRLLPTIMALFRAGRLSWSKIRLIASVADKDNEKTLCHAALDASVTDVNRLCSEYRWKKEDPDGREDGAAKSALSNQITQAAARNMALGMAEKEAMKQATALVTRTAVKTGQIAGFTVPSIGLSTGEIMTSIDRETGRRDESVKASLAGVVAGLADAAPLFRLARLAGVPAEIVRNGIMANVKKAGWEALKQAGYEGGTEAFQTIVEQAAVDWVEGNMDMFSEKDIDEILNAAASGALLGVVMGGGGSAIQSMRTPATADPTVKDIVSGQKALPASLPGYARAAAEAAIRAQQDDIRKQAQYHASQGDQGAIVPARAQIRDLENLLQQIQALPEPGSSSVDVDLGVSGKQSRSNSVDVDLGAAGPDIDLGIANQDAVGGNGIDVDVSAQNPGIAMNDWKLDVDVGDVILAGDDRPWKTERAAARALKRQKLEDLYRVAPTKRGYALELITNDQRAKAQSPAPEAGAAVEAAPAAADAAPKAEPKPAEQNDTEIVSGKVGQMMSSGQVVKTKTGRVTAPFPKIDTTSDRKTGNSLRRADEWLMKEALAEAESIGDDFNAGPFRQALQNIKNVSPADKDSAEEYLFGESPAIQPSRPILKPLPTASEEREQPAEKPKAPKPKKLTPKQRAEQQGTADSFTLTGSDRDADEAMAAGQQDLLSDPQPEFGASNTIFTKSAADKARELLLKKRGQLNAGIDPEVFQAGIQLAGYYIEGRLRSFSDYAKKMLEDLGDEYKPYLSTWYEGAKRYPGFTARKEMTPTAEVDEMQERLDAGANDRLSDQDALDSEALSRISTRRPWHKAADNDEIKENLNVGIDAYQEGGEKAFETNVAILTSYNNYRPSKRANTPEKQAQRFIAMARDNLLW